MSFFERSRPTSTRKRPAKGYATTPHNHVDAFVANVIGLNTHKYLKSKPMIKPVFKDEAQREAVHQEAKEYLRTFSVKDRWVGKYARFAGQRGLPAPKSGTAAEAAAYTDLYQRSRRGTASVRMNFTGITDPRASVRLIGHGGAGRMVIGSDAGELTSVEDVAEFFTKLRLPKAIKVKVDACLSAAGKKFDKSADELLRHFHDDTLKNMANTDHSFAANLHWIMKQQHNFVGPTQGYVMPTLADANEVLLPGGGTARHMAGMIQGNDSPEGPKYLVRKKDVRVTFTS